MNVSTPKSGPASWDVFIAHAGADLAAAEALYERLEEASTLTYLDSKRLLLGDDWDTELARAQSASLITAVLISSHADSAFYQREEIARAIDMASRHPSSHRVVPVYLACSEAVNVPYGLQLKHSIFINNISELDRVVVELQRAIASLKLRPASEEKVRGAVRSRLMTIWKLFLFTPLFDNVYLSLVFWMARAMGAMSMAIAVGSLISTQDYTIGVTIRSASAALLVAIATPWAFGPAHLLLPTARRTTFLAASGFTFLILLCGLATQSFYLDPMVSLWPGSEPRRGQSTISIIAFATLSWSSLAFIVALVYAFSARLKMVYAMSLVLFWIAAFSTSFGFLATSMLLETTSSIEIEFPRGYSVFPPILRTPDGYAVMFGTEHLTLDYLGIMTLASGTAALISGGFLAALAVAKRGKA